MFIPMAVAQLILLIVNPRLLFHFYTTSKWAKQKTYKWQIIKFFKFCEMFENFQFFALMLLNFRKSAWYESYDPQILYSSKWAPWI
jgi:hypothetical protein